AVPLVLVALTGGHGLALAATFVLLAGLPLHRALVHEPIAAKLNPVLGATARLLLLYSLLFSVGWILGD
ncbi:MAG TPA: 1,4-dihydroxy-2-naphthoate polyprenyltransferase, partial [Rhodothermales bacterium]